MLRAHGAKKRETAKKKKTGERKVRDKRKKKAAAPRPLGGPVKN